MESHRQSKSTPSKGLPFLVSLLGLLIAVLPLIYLPTSSGPVAFAILMMKAIGVIIGLGVVGVGLYSYRTGNPQPAMATGLAVIGLLIVGIIGGLIETTGGPLVPIWVWALSALLVVGTVRIVTNRFLAKTTILGTL
ncbi:hypothetical protein [Halolamina sp.]|uniref:hypothetical protein n=1 Tax=Halolamina sp. TaxID=1940283 RepID=UPI00356665DC